MITLPAQYKDLPKVIDVSRFQSRLNWDAVVAANVKAVFAKATDGENRVDPWFKNHWSNAQRVGIPIGSYHFFRYLDSWQSQFKLFMDTIGGNLGHGELPPWIDVEWSTKEEIDHLGNHWVDVLEMLKAVSDKLGVSPTVYTHHYFFTKVPDSGLVQFESYNLAVSDYESLYPILPRPWKKFQYWQYSDKLFIGDVNVDHSVFNGTNEQMQALVIK